ncbi:MAG: putative glycine dehydrogenase (decarboxylating) subunit 2 [Verrucomicrobia subdivision 3 bacterium]|nr:putative glycine dehydrogenase (decarboxylating) subunit 2 [Limisphaerales bacterium]MCS1413484.1 putative glycine dehydrogenase (decarboxylating) subunit 2 [Limisphaerales bacterium]
MLPPSLFDISRPGVSGSGVFDQDFSDFDPAACFGAAALSQDPIGLPELSEHEVVRHFTNLSRHTYGVDNGPYPLGSCTMKYSPKRNDALAQLPGFSKPHPHQPADSLQGVWEAFTELQGFVAELTGMDEVTLQPAAGAHGEFTGLLMIRKYFEEKGESRKTILIPDSAHGTNPASAAMVGFDCKIIPTTENGLMDLEAMGRLMDDDVAALMLTNPSTLGLFEKNIVTIAKRIHDQGALLYYDGANLNALMGVVRPGDMGFDVVHINTHKTLSTPHGGGGPGAGPVGVKALLAPYLPIPVIRRVDGTAMPDKDRPQSIGRVKAHFGHTEVLLRAYAYILTQGPDGLRTATENAVLNANYLQARLAELLPPVFDQFCMHECLLSGGHLKINSFDFVKRLIDFGVHPPTLVGAGCVYFAKEYDTAMLIEPTETESKATLNHVIEQFLKVAREAGRGALRH